MNQDFNKTLDAYLIKLKNGDRNALAVIDSLTQKRLLSYANTYYKNEEDCKDAVQELLKKLCEKIHRYYSTPFPFSWLVKILTNDIKTDLKKKKIETKAYEKYALENQIEQHTSDEYLSKHLLIKDTKSRLTKYEAKLFDYTIILGLSVNEVAKQMFKPKSTVQYQIEKLYEKLRNMKIF